MGAALYAVCGTTGGKTKTEAEDEDTDRLSVATDDWLRPDGGQWDEWDVVGRISHPKYGNDTAVTSS